MFMCVTSCNMCILDNREQCSPTNLQRSKVTGTPAQYWKAPLSPKCNWNTPFQHNNYSTFITTLQIIVHLMLHVGAYTLPCLLCWLPDLHSHHTGWSRTMGFCCFSLKGFIWVVMLSSDGIKTRNIGPMLKINKNFTFIIVNALMWFL